MLALVKRAQWAIGQAPKIQQTHLPAVVPLLPALALAQTGLLRHPHARPLLALIPWHRQLTRQFLPPLHAQTPQEKTPIPATQKTLRRDGSFDVVVAPVLERQALFLEAEIAKTDCGPLRCAAQQIA
jgi:hypothetical protein